MVRESRRSSTNEFEIFHVISGDLWAGAEAQVFQTLANLTTPFKDKIIVILFNDGQLKTKLNASGLKTILIDEKENGPWGIIKKLSQLMKRYDPRIIHVHAYKEHILGQLAIYLSKKSRHVFRTFHGITTIPKNVSILKKLKSVIIHLVEKTFLNHDRINIIAVSKDLERFLTKVFPKAHITQIYNSIRCPIENNDHEIAIRKQFNIGKDTLWIGTLARLAEVKNLPLLIEVAKYLRSRKVNFVISIFGDGPLKQILQEQIDASDLKNHVRLEGFNANILPILRTFDIFTITSFHEGLPMSLLEAMAVGTPVISTNVGGIVEVIVDGESGFLVSNMSPTAFGDKIMLLYENKNIQIDVRNNGKRTIEEKFNIFKNNQLLENLYKKELARSY